MTDADRRKQQFVMSVDYNFPVTFDTFMQHVNQDLLLRSMLAQHTQCARVREAILQNASLCRQLLYSSYKSFYIHPELRAVYEYRFKAPAQEWQTNLLESNASMAKLVYSQLADTTSQQAVAAPVEEDSAGDIVNFQVFQSYVKNLDSIVQQLKLQEPDYQCRSDADCALMYYRDFYETPEIRSKYPIQLKPCTLTMQKSILAMPSRQATHEPEPEPVVAADGDFAAVIEDCGTLGFYKFPVSCDTFKRYINYAELIVHLLGAGGQQLAADAAFKRYYHGFYLSTYVREQYDYRLQATPDADLRRQLLSYATPCSDHAERGLPVSFAFFKKHIANLSEIVRKMRHSSKYMGRTAEECEFAYYAAFYQDRQIRHKYRFVIKPCPSVVRQKLLDGTPEKQQSIVQAVGSSEYAFPVTFHTFKKYVNYDELKVRVANFYAKHDKEQVARILSCEKRTRAVMQRFYRTFYVKPGMRDTCAYNFNAAPEHMRAKLMEVAVELPSRTPAKPLRN